MSRHIDALPALDGVPADIAAMRDGLQKNCDFAKLGLARLDLKGLSPADAAQRLSAIGMPAKAMEVLRLTASTRLRDVVLGDLSLRLGRPDKARASYAAARWMNDAGSPGESDAAIDLRLALCDWVQGDLEGALAKLRPPGQGTCELGRAYYAASLLELMGQYEQARDSIGHWDRKATSTLAQNEMIRLSADLLDRLAGKPR